MKKIIGFVGSARKGGNTDVLIDAVLAGAKEAGAQVEKIALNEKEITPCQGCWACKEKGRCIIDDEMQSIYDALLAADAVVIGSPVYFFAVSGQTKVFLDRWFALFDKEGHSEMAGKKAGVVIVSEADPRKQGKCLLATFKMVFNFMGMLLEEPVMAQAREAGEVARRKEVIKRAGDLGSRLAN